MVNNGVEAGERGVVVQRCLAYLKVLFPIIVNVGLRKQKRPPKFDVSYLRKSGPAPRARNTQPAQKVPSLERVPQAPRECQSELHLPRDAQGAGLWRGTEKQSLISAMQIQILLVVMGSPPEGRQVGVIIITVFQLPWGCGGAFFLSGSLPVFFFIK